MFPKFLINESVPVVLVTGPNPVHKGFKDITIHNGIQASGRYEPDLTRNPEIFGMCLLWLDHNIIANNYVI